MNFKECMDACLKCVTACEKCAFQGCELKGCENYMKACLTCADACSICIRLCSRGSHLVKIF